jgi:hypothetical protein
MGSLFTRMTREDNPHKESVILGIVVSHGLRIVVAIVAGLVASCIVHLLWDNPWLTLGSFLCGSVGTDRLRALKVF